MADQRKIKEGMEARAAARRKERPKIIPDLTQAEGSYKPGKDRPMTLQQMRQAQDNIENMEQKEAAGLRPETIAGLQAMKAAIEEKTKMTQPQSPAPPMPEVEPAKAEEPTPEPEAEEPVLPKDTDFEKTVSRIDDLEFGQLMSQVSEDVINNKAERESVAKRVDPIDFTAGISSGEFTQMVPINKHLQVLFRTVSVEENRCIRALLFDMAAKDPRIEPMIGEIYGLMTVVASVVKINGTELPKHMKGSVYNAEFQAEVFEKKFNFFMRYPLPLIHALSTHGFWFDQRVRESFKGESTKNG